MPNSRLDVRSLWRLLGAVPTLASIVSLIETLVAGKWLQSLPISGRLAPAVIVLGIVCSIVSWLLSLACTDKEQSGIRMVTVICIWFLSDLILAAIYYVSYKSGLRFFGTFFDLIQVLILLGMFAATSVWLTLLGKIFASIGAKESSRFRCSDRRRDVGAHCSDSDLEDKTE